MNSPGRRMIAVLLCILLIGLFTIPVFADFGDFGGDNDWGGGGGDIDWGGDWDWDFDSDSDTRSFGFFSTSIGNFAVYIILFLIVFFIVHFVRSNKSKRTNRSSAIKLSSIPPLFPIESYHQLDPKFDAAKLQQKLSNLYIQMQQCWQAKNIESLRPYFTDTYYSQLERQLKPYRDNHITNCIERPAVFRVNLDGYCQSDGNDHIYATLQARLIDYKISDETGKVIGGSKTAEKIMTYRYHLIRPSGQISSNQDGVRSISCPHCGAPLSINESAKCPYCDSVITVDRYDFVIAQIEAISQQTM